MTISRAVGILILAVAVAGCSASAPADAGAGTVTGQAVGPAGEPIAGAAVHIGDRTASTDAEGRFTVDAPAGWVTVRRDGYLSRTRAAFPGDPLVVRLTPDDGATAALHFGGDVMAGRRFLDRDEDGDRADALVTDPADPDQHAALLAPAAPLLADADLTTVNLESPVVADPHVEESGTAHPTKDYVFASGTGLPGGLAAAGVDVLGLANNHQYDLLDDGVTSTMSALDDAGFPAGSGRFGLGADLDAAWLPAVREVAGTTIAFLGCTTVTGSEHDLDYVAEPAGAGAAPCEEGRLRAAVSAAAAAHDLVVVSVHGGFEYEREPSKHVRTLAEAARQAGAQLVINHHPHVTGGLDWDGRGLIAWSLGNLMFDQTVWPSFQSYVLAVHVRGGEVIRAYLEPLVVHDYVPRGLDTALGDRIARTAAGLSTGPFVVEDGAVELDLGPHPDPTPVAVPLDGSAEGRITELAPGVVVADADPARVQAGHDLLWVGDFESGVLGAEPGALWATGPGSEIALDPTGHVARLRRDGFDSEAVIGTTIHRMLLTNPGSAGLRRYRGEFDLDDPGATAPLPGGLPPADAEVSLSGWLRVTPGARVEVRIAWFSETRGASSSHKVLVPEDAGGWQPLRLDTRTPPDAVAAAVQVRLAPPEPGARPARVDVDGLRVIEWLPRGTPAPRTATHLRSFQDTEANLQQDGQVPAGEPLRRRP